MQKNKATPSEKKAALEAIKAQFKGNDCQAQRDRLLAALKSGLAVSTFEARQDLAMKRNTDWLKELEVLAWRFAHLGFGPDLAGMTIVELAGLHAYLSRLAERAG
jgi:hypothetical protein